jgi:peroxiredoxin Q/BCP
MITSLFSDLVPVGSPAPDFSLPDDTGQTITLSKLRGKSVVLVFYPADSTPT